MGFLQSQVRLAKPFLIVLVFLTDCLLYFMQIVIVEWQVREIAMGIVALVLMYTCYELKKLAVPSFSPFLIPVISGVN